MKNTNLPRAERSEPIGERSRSAFFTGTLLIIMGLTLSACASLSLAPTPTAIPTISLDNNPSSQNNSPSDPDAITASAVIVPVNDVQLSFSAVGRVTDVKVKVGDKVMAGDPLVTLDTTLLEARVKEAEANLAVAQVQVNYLKRIGTDEVHLESAQAEADRAQALLDSANTILATQPTLVAPFDGTIVSVDISPAETVVPGRVIIIIGDLSRFQVETKDLSERDVPRVQVGQTASVFIEPLNEEFSGKVIDISRISSTVGGDVVFKVTIDLDEQPQGLLWGMSADVSIETGTQE